MNEVRLKGTVRFAPKTFAAGVRVGIQPEGETSAVDVVAWTNDAPDAVRVLSSLAEGAGVWVQGKLSRSKEKRLGKLDASGNLVESGAWVMSVSALKAGGMQVVAAPPPPTRPPPTSDDDIPF